MWCVYVCYVINGRTDRCWTIDTGSRGGRLVRWPPKSASSTTITSKAVFHKSFGWFIAGSQIALMSVFLMLSSFSLRTSETSYLNEAFSFYSAIRQRSYYYQVNKEDR